MNNSIRFVVLAAEEERKAAFMLVPPAAAGLLGQMAASVAITVSVRVGLLITRNALQFISESMQKNAEFGIMLSKTLYGGRQGPLGPDEHMEDVVEFLTRINRVLKAEAGARASWTSNSAGRAVSSILSYFSLQGGVVTDVAGAAGAVLLSAAFMRILPLLAGGGAAGSRLKAPNISEQIKKINSMSNKVASAAEIAGTTMQVAQVLKKASAGLQDEDAEWEEAVNNSRREDSLV